jgi:Skp family chaperone for outer membrane proteins
MRGRFFPDKHINNSRVRRPINARVFVWLTVIAVAGAIVAAGFVISARQRVKAINLGYQSGEMRREAARLEEERDKLQSEMDSISSDIDIEKRALGKGLKRPASSSRNIRRPTSK